MSGPLGFRRARRARSPRLRQRIWSPPGHWRLLAICLTVVVVILAFEGVVTHTIGSTAEPTKTSASRAPLLHTRPILTAEGDRLVSHQPPPGRRVVLTFDDGPDPRWTPAIVHELRAAHAPGAFFLVGSEAARHPDLVRMLARDGMELGNHTFTHTALSNGSRWQRRAQLDLTESVVAGITGHYTRLVRPPYSATPDAVTPDQETALARLAGSRYYIVLADFDSEDWRRHSVEDIVRRATPPGRQGGIVMFHDGGGDRRRTVAAVRELIPRLRARGFRITTLADLAGVPGGVFAPPAGGAQHVRGLAYTWAVRSAFFMADLLSALMIAIAVLVGLRFLVILALATRHRRDARARAAALELAPAAALPPITVIVPAYNEEVGIERAVRSLAASDYPDLEIVVVDDGSSDRTAEIVESLGLPMVHLVRQDNAGKAAALNTGIRMSRTDIVVMVDGDTVFEPETLRRLVAPFADDRVGAVAGNTKVGNRGGLLGRWQHIEYVMGFNLDRRMYEMLQCTPTVPGAIGAFRRDVLEEVGGVPGDTLAEDTDLTLAIGRTGRRVVYAEEARAWTEAPSTLNGLWRQRYRWSYGTMQAVWKHRGAIVGRAPGDRRIGRRAIPYMFAFQIALPLVAPVIDLLAIYGAIFTNPLHVAAAWLAFNALQVGLGLYAFRLDGESPRPLWALPLQQFVYRQLMYVVIIESTISALIGVRAGWKTIPRTGDVAVGVEA